mgnify:CR=1 FL=1
MKIILIIMVMLAGVNVGAQSLVDTFNNGGGQDTYFDGGRDTYFDGGQDTYFDGGQDTYFDGGRDTDANIMLGNDGDNNNAAGAGLNRGSNSELYRTPNYSPNNRGGVPKLSLEGIVLWLVGIMNQLVYVIIGAALVMFLYGILKLSFIDGQKPEAREQARKFMFWGIVSLFVMVSVWGLVNLLRGSFNLDNSNICLLYTSPSPRD